LIDWRKRKRVRQKTQKSPRARVLVSGANRFPEKKRKREGSRTSRDLDVGSRGNFEYTSTTPYYSTLPQ